MSRHSAVRRILAVLCASAAFAGATAAPVSAELPLPAWPKCC